MGIASLVLLALSLGCAKFLGKAHNTGGKKKNTLAFLTVVLLVSSMTVATYKLIQYGTDYFAISTLVAIAAVVIYSFTRKR